MEDPAINDEPAAILRTIYPALLRLAGTLVGWDEREDVVQDALVSVLRRHPGFAGIRHPLGYTRTVVIRTAVGKMRATAVAEQTSASMERVDSDLIEENVVGRAAFADAILRLGPKQRACIYLRYAADLSDDQISDVLGCRRSTVRSQISRALETLSQPT